MYLHRATATLMTIPDGTGGIAATLRLMRAIVRQYKKELVIREQALLLTAMCGHHDWMGEIKVLHAHVRDRIRYVGDVTDVETVQTPDRTIEYAAGDCDDKAVLLASMLESIGHPTRFVAIGFEPGVFCHVWAETKIGDNWVTLEATEEVEVGWMPDAPIRERMVMYN